MKKISLLCQKLLLLGVLISVPGTIFGQNTIYSLPRMSTDNSIIREYQSGIYIVYNRIGQGGHDFLYVDVNVPVVYKVSSPVNLPTVQINDFEIWEDELYFCGTDGTSGLVGHFNIPTMFLNPLGSWNPLYYAYVPTLDECTYGTTVTIANLRRLELHPVNGGMHILAIGENAQGTARSVLDLGHDFSNTGYCEVISVEATGGLYFYDDVVVTSAGIYVVGHKNGSHGQYLQPYPLPTTPNVSWGDNIFLTTNCIPKAILIDAGETPDFYPVSPFLAEYLYNDYFATVCYSSRVCTPGVDIGVAISIYDGSATLIDRTHITLDQVDLLNWGLIEFKYSPWSDKLYLLHHSVVSAWSQSVEPILCVVDMNPFPVGATAYKSPLIAKPKSIDRTRHTSEAVVIGDFQDMMLWTQMSSSSGCILEEPLQIDPLVLENWWFHQEEYPTDPGNAPWDSLYLRLVEIDINSECEE